MFLDFDLFSKEPQNDCQISLPLLQQEQPFSSFCMSFFLVCQKRRQRPLVDPSAISGSSSGTSSSDFYFKTIPGLDDVSDSSGCPPGRPGRGRVPPPHHRADADDVPPVRKRDGRPGPEGSEDETWRIYGHWERDCFIFFMTGTPGSALVD